MAAAAKTFKIGQHVQVTRGLDRGNAGTVTDALSGGVYVVVWDEGVRANRACGALKASSLKAI